MCVHLRHGFTKHLANSRTAFVQYCSMPKSAQSVWHRDRGPHSRPCAESRL